MELPLLLSSPPPCPSSTGSRSPSVSWTARPHAVPSSASACTRTDVSPSSLITSSPLRSAPSSVLLTTLPSHVWNSARRLSSSCTPQAVVIWLGVTSRPWSPVAILLFSQIIAHAIVTLSIYPIHLWIRSHTSLSLRCNAFGSSRRRPCHHCSSWSFRNVRASCAFIFISILLHLGFSRRYDRCYCLISYSTQVSAWSIKPFSIRLICPFASSLSLTSWLITCSIAKHPSYRAHHVTKLPSELVLSPFITHHQTSTFSYSLTFSNLPSCSSQSWL